MRESGPATVSLFICESILVEESGAVSAIRIMDVVTLGRLAEFLQFFVVSFLHSRPHDFNQHTARVTMTGLRNRAWVSVASAPAHNFVYSYGIAPDAPGAHLLRTEFNLNLTTLGELGTFWIQLTVDGEMVEQTPITLLRQHD